MKKGGKNKAVSYILILAILIGIGLFLKYKKSDAPSVVPDPTEQTQNIGSEVSIGSKTINEENFSARFSVLSGGGELVKSANRYIDTSITDFKKQADADVPDMRKRFGADSPVAQYEIDIEAKYIKGEKTESIVMLSYAYTGGAHGNSAYKVISASMSSGEILSLADIVKNDKKDAFVALVKKELLAWRPDGASGSPVFREEVELLKFDSFGNWSLDDKNLTLYFSQYEIGPGVLGPVAFPVSLEKITDLLQ